MRESPRDTHQLRASRRNRGCSKRFSGDIWITHYVSQQILPGGEVLNLVENTSTLKRS